jgi:predicted HTH domain antitoxin
MGPMAPIRRAARCRRAKRCWPCREDGNPKKSQLAFPPAIGYAVLVQVDIPDTALTGTGLTPDQVRLEVAVALYRDRKVSMGRAVRLAGLPRVPFQRELARRGVTVDHDVAEFEEDLRNISALDRSSTIGLSEERDAR